MRDRGLRVVAIASPLLKCVLPDGPGLDERWQQDTFASVHQFDDQPRLARRAFEIAERLGARIVRVFSFWRTTHPEGVADRIAGTLYNLADEATARGLIVGLENEHACNVGTGDEAARMLTRVDHPALQIVWDPANALIGGESSYPPGYDRLPPDRIAHVHAKDCHVRGHVPTWCALGEGEVGWPGQIAALVRDRYAGAIHLETH